MRPSIDTLTIRQTGPADLGPIDTLLSRTYPVLLKADYPPSVMVTTVPVISRARPSLISSGTYFAVELEDQIVGAGGWTWARPNGGKAKGVASVRHVVTDHRRVRQGIGRALLEHIMTSARHAGVERLEALSTRTAVPFYSAMGFWIDQPVEVAIGPAGLPFPSVRMERPL